MLSERELKRGFIETIARNIKRSASIPTTRVTTEELQQDLKGYSNVMHELGIFPTMTVETSSGQQQIPGIIVQFNPQKLTGHCLTEEGEFMRYRVKRRSLDLSLSHPILDTFQKNKPRGYKHLGKIALGKLHTTINAHLEPKGKSADQ